MCSWRGAPFEGRTPPRLHRRSGRRTAATGQKTTCEMQNKQERMSEEQTQVSAHDGLFLSCSSRGLKGLNHHRKVPKKEKMVHPIPSISLTLSSTEKQSLKFADTTVVLERCMNKVEAQLRCSLIWCESNYRLLQQEKKKKNVFYELLVFYKFFGEETNVQQESPGCFRFISFF